MADKPIYHTTRSAKVSRKLFLNGFGAVVLSLLSGWLWRTGGHWLQAMIFCIMAPLAGLVIATIFRSRNPLQIYDDRIVLSTTLRTALPLANIKGIGTDPKRGTPSLTYLDEAKGHSGEISILWRFIAEPQADVLRQVEDALDRRPG